jgi:hypothetical protein
MTYQTDSFTADTAPDTSTRLTMRAALFEFRKVMRDARPVHPLREEMLGVLADARVRIDRINTNENSASLSLPKGCPSKS